MPNFGQLIVGCTKSDHRYAKITALIDDEVMKQVHVFKKCFDEEVGVTIGVQMSRQSRQKYNESLNNISNRTIRSLL